MKPSNSSKPHLIITVGIPGSGKSFFAEHFAETFKAPLISYERFKTQTHDLSPETLDSFSKYMMAEIFKTGQTAVLDGPAETRTERVELAHAARVAGYEPLFVWVQTDEETAKKRATKSDDKHKISISNDEFDALTKRFSPPHKVERAVVISGKHNYASQLKIVLRNLASISNVDSSNPAQPPHVRRNVVLR